MEVRSVYFYKYVGVNKNWADNLSLSTLDKTHVVNGAIEANGVVTYSPPVDLVSRNFKPINFIGVIDNKAHILDVIPTETQAPTVTQVATVAIETAQPTNEQQLVIETAQPSSPAIVETAQPTNEQQPNTHLKQKIQVLDKEVRAVIEANNKRKLEAEQEAILAQQARDKAEAANKELIAQREQADKEAAAEIATKIQATLQRTPAQQIEDLERDNMGQERLIARAAGRQEFVEQCKAKIESNLQKIQALKSQIATA
jgi:hypothetical protein